MSKPFCDLCGKRACYTLRKQGNTLKLCLECFLEKDTDKIAEIVETGVEGVQVE